MRRAELRKLVEWLLGADATEKRIKRFIKWAVERPASADRWAAERAREQRTMEQGRRSW